MTIEEKVKILADALWADANRLSPEKFSGDQAELQAACQEAQAKQKIANELYSIIGEKKKKEREFIYW